MPATVRHLMLAWTSTSSTVYAVPMEPTGGCYASGVPHFAPGGAFAGYIGSDIDITDLKRAQVEDAERQKLESLGALTSGIAHDFNNLLGSVLADAELAELEAASGSSPAEHIQRIKAVAVRAAEIVRELMIYSGQDQADLGSVDLSRLVEEMLELLKVSISKHAILKTDLRNGLPAVRGNAAQVRQIVMNLIINASEALGEKDGLIHVATSFAGRNLPSFAGTNLPDADYLCLSVSDTGSGSARSSRQESLIPSSLPSSPAAASAWRLCRELFVPTRAPFTSAAPPAKAPLFRSSCPAPMFRSGPALLDTLI